MPLRTIGRRRGLAAGFALALVAPAAPALAQAPRFEVTLAPAASAAPVTGRLVLMVSRAAQPEPRLALSLRGPAVFGVDLDQLRPGQAVVVDDGAAGYPMRLSELPPGDYHVQAVVNVYDRVQRADGKTIWVPMNDGRIEFFNTAAGNLYSEPQQVRIGRGGTVRLAVTQVIPPRDPPRDTEWIRHVSVRSEKLTRFWGRPVFIHAAVLLPKGYDEHPDVRYPSLYTLGHGRTPLSFTTTPPAAGRGGPGVINPATGLEHGYETYRQWSGDGFPRVIAISLEQQTPYFADSYSVNSANNGPYGDAIVEEVIPYLEQRFRIIREPWARQLEGASTSGWQTLALQLHYPDFFGGAWVLQPDPIDFTRYVTTDIYADTNAFAMPLGQWGAVERGFQRTPEGQVLHTMRELSRFEAVLGSRGRSGFQLAAWEAVYGPVGDDGYPKPLWDPRTGTIDRAVAHYMRDSGYDLRAHAERNWPTLGPKLAGKLHFFLPDMDDFHLNLAMYRFEDFLRGTTNPRSDATWTYGRPMKGHSWHAWTWAGFVREAAARVRASAPPGANTAQWHY